MRFPLRFILPATAALFLCCTWAISIHAAEKNDSYRAALESIQADDLGEQVDALADNAMEGREAGTRGGHAAGDYLAEQYARFHLQGAGTDGGFFQLFAPNFRNVLAVLKGSDPQWRDQVIVIGAHYDHVGYGGHGLGLGPYGYVHPGADDNASGTSAVLELAQAFTVLSVAPRRSIVFALWDAEEKGLLGSKYWVTHPTIALDRIVAAVNLDMIGRLRDEHVTVFGARSGYGWRRLLSSQNDSGLQLEFSWCLKPNADHYPFFDHNIPVLMLHTGMHDQYHRPSDVAKQINTGGMTRITRLLFGAIYEMAEHPATAPGFRAAARYETPEAEKAVLEQIAKPADRLGVRWIEDAALSGGVRISDVVAGSPADRSGLRRDDRIVRFAGRDILSDDDFFGAVAMAENQTVASIQRPGEEKPRETTLELPGNPLRWGIVWRVDDAEPGVIILTHVVPGSPAAWAGLRVGDRIYQVAGRDFTDEGDFVQRTKTLSFPLPLLIERDGRLRTIVLQMHRIDPAKRAA